MQSLVSHSLRGLKIPMYGLKILPNLTYTSRTTMSVYSACLGSWTSKLFQDNDSKIIHQQTRHTGFFNKLSATDLWKSTASVSRAGMRRGRGRKINASMIKDLNRGQVLGCGEINMQWPGLNAPVFRGSEKVQQQRLPDDEDRMAKILERRGAKLSRKRRIHPLDRGFCGSKIDGMKIAPDVTGGKFDKAVRPVLHGFETVVLHTRVTSRMVGRLGRVAKWNVLVAVGNKNGVVGIARGRNPVKYGAVLLARSKAQQRLLYIERHNKQSVLHDFFTTFGRSKVEVRKKPEGYGLKCQRVLKIICELAGIKDIRCKFHGTRNLDQNVKAFLLGLINQKSHQTIADEVGLNIVEIDPARHNFPKVIASPEKCSERKKFEHESMCNFSHYTMANKVVLKREKLLPAYTKTLGWQNYLSKYEKKRNQDDVKRRLKVKYGKVQSFYAAEFPEAVEFVLRKRRKLST